MAISVFGGAMRAAHINIMAISPGSGVWRMAKQGVWRRVRMCPARWYVLAGNEERREVGIY
jgi:hypothetical protein